MQKARYLVALSCAWTSVACGTEVARAVYSAEVDAGPSGPPGIPEKPPPCRTGKLTDRLTRGRVVLDEGVRYKRTDYFFGFPQDDRIAFSASNNNVMVAWLNSAGTQVHVTPVQVGTDTITRYAPDVIVPGTELSGLVALEDGFALLTRRPDLGEPIGEGMTQMQATYWVRSLLNGREISAVPLTGTRVMFSADADIKRDYPNGPSGRIAFNGSRYGIYLGVRGGLGDRYRGANGDKFLQFDEDGKFLGGWRMGCRQNLGGRLVSEASGFVAFCMSDGTIETPGVTLVLGPFSTRRLALEAAAPAYAGGNFGSAVKTASGYMVVWASRGVKESNTQNPAFDSHEPAVAVVNDNRMPVPPPVFPFLPAGGVPARDAVNVHAAPYGDDRVLIVWETIDAPQLSDGFSTGTYGGTHFQLVDLQGKKASEEEFLLEAIAPNGPDDIVQFPNGDIGWAYVPEGRDFQTPVTEMALANLRSIAEIRFVRLQLCAP